MNVQKVFAKSQEKGFFSSRRRQKIWHLYCICYTCDLSDFVRASFEANRMTRGCALLYKPVPRLIHSYTEGAAAPRASRQQVRQRLTMKRLLEDSKYFLT